MNNTQYDNFKIEIAVLQQNINKWNPGSASFSIPALLTSKVSEKTTPNTTYNLQNKNKDIGITRVTTSNTITLEVPKEYTTPYPQMTIPKGVQFLVGFIGGDISTAKIIGRFY